MECLLFYSFVQRHVIHIHNMRCESQLLYKNPRSIIACSNPLPLHLHPLHVPEKRYHYARLSRRTVQGTIDPLLHRIFGSSDLLPNWPSGCSSRRHSALVSYICAGDW